MTPKGAAKFMAAYAKSYHAGAFGSPMATELEASPGLLQIWEGRGASVCMAVVRHLRHDEQRKDWTGRKYRLPKGASVATFTAQTGNHVPEALNAVDFIFAYAEDDAFTTAMESWRRPRVATRISAASEIITCWGPRGWQAPRELPADRLTATRIPAELLPQWPERLRSKVLDELDSLDEWHDDYPFYSDGTWGAINLRGFNPADPLWGVKPSEMPRTWQHAHRADMKRTCDWTVACEMLPTMRALIEDVPWWRSLERVRLMRMAGRAGGGRLSRHTDVTDKAAGTRDGQVARFHIPLVTSPTVTMSVWELDGTQADLHLPAWTVWYLDQRKPHAVTNPTQFDRIHLVADVIVDPGVRTYLERLVQ